MSIYRIGTVLRMTRCALGISQEELCAGICSVQTLSRMENAKVHGKRAVYAQLMEKMGRDGSRAHSKLATFDMDALDHMAKVDTAIHKHEYAEAEILLGKILPNLRRTAQPMTEQWARKKELLLQYRRSAPTEQSLDAYLRGTEELLKRTIADYEVFLDSAFPFFQEELVLLMNIATAYEEKHAYEKAVRINNMLIRSLDMGYMDEETTAQLKAVLLNNTAKYYTHMGEHETAIQMKWGAIQIARENALISVLANAYFGIVHSMMWQIDLGERKETDLELCKHYLLLGCAAASAAGNVFMRDYIANFYREQIGEDAYLISMAGSEKGTTPQKI